MKILVVSQYFYPEQFRINDVCFELVKRGHDVTVLTGLPNYPSGEIYPGYEQKGNTEEIINGVRVVRCELRPRHKGTINLVRNYFSFVRQANKLIKRLDKDFQIVYVYGVSPITQALPAIKYKNKYKVPVFYYCLDLWPEAVLGEQNGHKQIGKKNPVFLLAKLISKHVYKKVDKIGVKCNSFKQYLESYLRIDKTKITLLYEHAETTYLSVGEHPVDNGCLDFMFLGNMGKIQNCDLIINAFYKMKNNVPSMLHFVGDGSELNKLKKIISTYGISDRVIFHGYHPINEIIKYYELADVCILALSNKTMTGLTIPAKLTGYLAAARPIIASVEGESQTIINEANCGFACSADNVDDLRLLFDKASDYYSLPSKLQQLGKNGREFFLKHFTINQHILNLEAILAGFFVNFSN